MKKMIAMCMAMVLMVTLSACDPTQELQDMATSFVEELIEGFQMMLEEQVEHVKGMASEFGDDCMDLWYGFTDFFVKPKDCYTITYVTGNGEYMAPAQVAKGRKFEITVIPMLENHHFIAWSPDSQPTEERVYHLPNTHFEVNEDLVLYAVWMSEESLQRSHTGEASLDIPWKLCANHGCKVTDKNNVVQIKCTSEACSLEISDRSMSRDAFFAYCDYKSDRANLTMDEQKDFGRKYALYVAREYGPALVTMTERFYRNPPDNLDAISWLDPVQECLDLMGFAVEVDGNYAKLLEVDATDPTASAYNRTRSDYFFANLADDIESGTNAIAFFRACCYFSGAVDKHRDISDSTAYLIKTVNTIVGYAPGGSYLEPQLELLEEGVKLWGKCTDHDNDFFAVMDTALDSVDGLDSYGLSHFLDSQYVTVLDQARNGIFMENAPSALEVIDRILQEPGAYGLMSNRERMLINYYITQYLDYQFQQATGVTLEQYIGYWQDSDDQEKADAPAPEE